ncbi:unnamed protein product [Ectocarpus sp. 12 AP-2014]
MNLRGLSAKASASLPGIHSQEDLLRRKEDPCTICEMPKIPSPNAASSIHLSNPDKTPEQLSLTHNSTRRQINITFTQNTKFPVHRGPTPTLIDGTAEKNQTIFGKNQRAGVRLDPHQQYRESGSISKAPENPNIQHKNKIVNGCPRHHPPSPRLTISFLTWNPFVLFRLRKSG